MRAQMITNLSTILLVLIVLFIHVFRILDALPILRQVFF
jgi:hypothetical protein